MAEAHEPDLAAARLHLLDEGGDLVLRPDLREHAQHLLVGPAVQGAVEGGDGGGNGRVGIHVGAPHPAHGRGRAVLLVVGVQDEEHLEGLLHHRVDLVGPSHLEHHLQEVAAVGEVVVGVGVGQALGVAVGEGGQGGDLGDQAEDLVVPLRRVMDVLGLGIEGGEGGHGGAQHAHGVGVVAEGRHQLLDVLVDHRVVRDVVGPLLVLGLGGQLAVQDQVGRLQVAALLGQLLDGIAAVVEDALVPVDEGDAALARGGVGEGGVVGHEAEVVGRGLDLPEVEGPDGAVLYGQLVGLPVAVVRDGEAVLGHD